MMYIMGMIYYVYIIFCVYIFWQVLALVFAVLFGLKDLLFGKTEKKVVYKYMTPDEYRKMQKEKYDEYMK